MKTLHIFIYFISFYTNVLHASVLDYKDRILLDAEYLVSVESDRSGLSEDELHGYQLSLGYAFGDRLSSKVGYTSYDLSNNINRDFFSIALQYQIPLSTYAGLYLSGGTVVDADFSPQIGLGMYYSLSSNMDLKVGYKTTYNLNEINDELYSFVVGLSYRFNKDDSSLVEYKVKDVALPSDDMKGVSDESPTLLNDVEVNECSRDILKYVVKSGDWLHKITRMHEMTFKELELLNEYFFAISSNIDLISPGDVLNVYTPSCSR
ncbi:outer membrane beta-barrel protein [Vibrio jasicida]|uniref:outer membrane beta-barrel protein n=1 Tax=Vibrio jasicida TaxID=766224 RepID=UPI0005EE8863|nr:outer membrane beta-barrel protein [Vibrio jasicida]